MVLNDMRAAAKNSRRLNGATEVRRIIGGVRFTDGLAAGDFGRDRAA